MDERVQITIGNKRRSDCKIVVDGLDISSLTQSFTIKADTDSVPTLELTLIPVTMTVTGNPDIVNKERWIRPDPTPEQGGNNITFITNAEFI